MHLSTVWCRGGKQKKYISPKKSKLQAALRGLRDRRGRRPPLTPDPCRHAGGCCSLKGLFNIKKKSKVSAVSYASLTTFTFLKGKTNGNCSLPLCHGQYIKGGFNCRSQIEKGGGFLSHVSATFVMATEAIQMGFLRVFLGGAREMGFFFFFFVSDKSE